MSENLETHIQALEKLIQEKLLNCEEFHDICYKLKDEKYDIDMGIFALLMNYKDDEKGFVSFPFYLDFNGNKKNEKFEITDKDKKFLNDLGISI